MDWTITPETANLISPLLARNYWVIPLGMEGSTVKLAMGKKLTTVQQQNAQRALEACLGKPVSLQTLEDLPDLQFCFDEILDKHYGTPPPDKLTTAISMRAATLLLVDPDESRRTKHTQWFQSKGFTVVEASNLQQMETILQTASESIAEILHPPNWKEKDEAKRRLRLLFPGVKLSPVLHAIKNPCQIDPIAL